MSMPDFSHELAALLEHVAHTAIAIRQHSAYARAKPSPDTQQKYYDLLWLADSLHNLDSLGRAIMEEKPDRIIYACDQLTSLYKRYDTENTNSKDTFERAKKYGISLSHAIEIFQEIKLKAIAKN